MRRSPLESSCSWFVAASAVCLLTSCGGGGGFGAGILVQIVTTSLPAASTGQEDYAAAVTASFPHPPGTYFVTGGTLPPGLTLGIDTGEVHGIPRQAGSYFVEITARDGPNPAYPPGGNPAVAEDSHTYVVVVADGPPNLIPSRLPPAPYGSPYSFLLPSAGGTAPYGFLEVSDPPDGLPADFHVTPDGYVAGLESTTADVGRRFHFAVRLFDSAGRSDVEEYDLDLVLKPLLIYTASPLPPAAADFPYSTTLRVASPGAGGPYLWTQVAPTAGETLLSDVDLEVTFDGLVRSVVGAPGPKSNPPVPLPPAPYTISFTLNVTDAALQPGVDRTFSLTVSPGPVLSSVSPRNAIAGGPFTFKGLNFQPGARLVFRPSSSQVSVLADFVDATTLVLGSPPPTPVLAAGAVAVRVENPDGGRFTLPNAFVFPAKTWSFGTKGFIPSPLSSTGLDCADVDGDGLADVVHCGAIGMTVYSGSPHSTTGGLYFHRNLGGDVPSFASSVLSAGSYYDVRFADVNVDGRPDVVALSATAIHTWLNGVGGDPPGTFAVGPVSTLPLGFSSTMFPSQMSIGQLNADSVPDVAIAVPHWPTANADGRVLAMAGDGSGSFTLLDAASSTISGTYGVLSLACVDTDGDGVDEIAAGVGMNQGTGPLLHVASVNGSGSFTPWVARGGPVTNPTYGSTTGVIAGNFLGDGTPCVVATMTGAPARSPASLFAVQAGAGLATDRGSGSYPSVVLKSACALDLDFDRKTDWAASTGASGVWVFRAETQTKEIVLDAVIDLPLLGSPRTGRVASGDLDGDGRPDLLATTSFWAVNGMAAQYGATYTLNACGDGGSMGVVFWLNTSR